MQNNSRLHASVLFPLHNKFIFREIYTGFILFIAQFLEIAANVFDIRR